MDLIASFDLPTTLCGLFAACLSLGVGTQRNWQSIFPPPWNKKARMARWSTLAFGWSLLAIAILGFSERYGWEIGFAWLALWLGAATFVATLWISLRPRSILWISPSLAVLSLVARWY